MQKGIGERESLAKKAKAIKERLLSRETFINDARKYADELIENPELLKKVVMEEMIINK